MKSVTLTIIANMTSNYGESLGNVTSVQKVFKKGKTYATRSRESLKNAIMVESGLYDDLEITVDSKVAQKVVSEELNATNCRALEGGYMNTKVGKDGRTCIRNSSIYLTDAISCEPFVLESRFHNNLHSATTFAKANNLNVQNDSKGENKVGLMPYNYEYDKNMKIYSLTIDLTKIGKDENFNTKEADNKEKCERVIAVLNAVESLNLVVKGNLDNAEPLFVIGGLSDRMTHQFENVVSVHGGKLKITPDLKNRLEKGYKAALLEGENFENEFEIMKELNTISVSEFFDSLRSEVKAYYEV